MSEDAAPVVVGNASGALKDITFGSVSLVYQKVCSTARTQDLMNLCTQIAGMTSKLFEHPFDLGEHTRPRLPQVHTV